jgi:curved DNA-binding protein
MWLPSYYVLLQVSPEASQEEIRSAYRRLARRYHPDGTDPNPQLMRLLNAAYEVLRDPAKRRQYDLFLTLHLRRPEYRPPPSFPSAPSPPLGPASLPSASISAASWAFISAT